MTLLSSYLIFHYFSDHEMTTPHGLRKSTLGTPTTGRFNQAFKSPFRSPLANSSVPAPILNSDKGASLQGFVTEIHSKSVLVDTTSNKTISSTKLLNKESTAVASNATNIFVRLENTVNVRKFTTPRTSLKRQYPGNSCETEAAKPFQPPFKSPLLKCEASPGTSYGQSPLLNRAVTNPKSVSETSTPKRPCFSRSNVRCSIQNKSPLNFNSRPQLEQLLQQEKVLDEEISALEAEGYNVEELQTHIEKLHRYNDLKDVAQIVMGQLATMENESVKKMHERYEVANLD